MKRRSFIQSIVASVIGAVSNSPLSNLDAQDKDSVEIKTRQVDAQVVGSSTPIVIEPEVLSIVKSESQEKSTLEINYEVI